MQSNHHEIRHKVLNMGHWNCRMGLLGAEGLATDKLEEVANFIHQHNQHILGVSETALHGQASRIRRLFPTSRSAIKHHLAIPGFNIILPETWKRHDQARVIIYVKESINPIVIKLYQNFQDLPLVTLELWKEQHKRQFVSYFYREHTGGCLTSAHPPVKWTGGV